MVCEAVVSILEGTTTGHPESWSVITRKDFPATVKEFAETDSKGLEGLSSHIMGFCCWVVAADMTHRR